MLRLTDAGGQLLLDIALGDATKFASLDLRLFTDAGALQDGQATREWIADAGCTTTMDTTTVTDTIVNLLLPLTTTAGLSGGIPIIQWYDAVWVFSGALTNAVNKTIKGVSIVAGSTIIAEQLLPAPFTPANAGDSYTISPAVMMGNVPGYASNPA